MFCETVIFFAGKQMGHVTTFVEVMGRRHYVAIKTQMGFAESTGRFFFG